MSAKTATDVIQLTVDSLPGGQIWQGEKETVHLWAFMQKRTYLVIPENPLAQRLEPPESKRAIVSDEDETLLYLRIDQDDIPAIAQVLADRRRAS